MHAACREPVDIGLQETLTFTPSPMDATPVNGRPRALAALMAATGLLAACSLIPPAGCPQALLTGQLAASDDGRALVVGESGESRVIWPDGYTVDLTPEVVLRGPLGNVVASEGDTIYVGGGQDPDDPDAFRACGHISRDPP
jgi:hypothetical protein